LMRCVSLSAGHAGKFSWSGSIFIVAIYAVAMMPGAVAAAITLRRRRWFCAVAGSVFLLFPAVGVASEELGDTAGLSTVQWIVVSATSLSVFATIALVPLVTVWTVDRLYRRAAPADPSKVDPVVGSTAAPTAMS